MQVLSAAERDEKIRAIEAERSGLCPRGTDKLGCDTEHERLDREIEQLRNAPAVVDTIQEALDLLSIKPSTPGLKVTFELTLEPEEVADLLNDDGWSLDDPIEAALFASDYGVTRVTSVEATE